MTERLPTDNPHSPDLAGRAPEAEPLHEFTVVVEEVYLVPYRIRATDEEDAVHRVLDKVEGEEQWEHVEWAEGSGRLLYAAWRNPPPRPAASAAAPGPTGAPHVDAETPATMSLPTPPRAEMTDYHRARPLPEGERVIYRLTTLHVDDMLETLGVNVEAISDEQREVIYAGVQRLIKRSDIWGEQFYHTVDAAADDLPSHPDRDL